MIYIFIIISFLSVLICPSNVSAASLSLDPADLEVEGGQNLELKINVDSASDETVGIDAVLIYDRSFLQFNQVKNGSYFPSVASKDEDGKVYVFAMVNSFNEPKSGQGTIASVVFTAIKEGNITLGFDCGADLVNESNIIINDENATDIINCTENGKTNIRILSSANPLPASAVSPTPTSVMPTATTAPTEIPYTPTPSPEALPRTGGGEAQITATPTAVASMPRAGVYENLILLIFVSCLAFSSGVYLLSANKNS